MSIRTNCPNCGAPIDTHYRKCPYCETPYEEQKIILNYADNTVYETEIFDPSAQHKSDFDDWIETNPEQAAECVGIASRIASTFGIGISQCREIITSLGSGIADIFRR